MVLHYRLDKTFGPFGSSTGLFLFIGGIIATWFSAFGLILAFIGAFASFTTTGTTIDTEKRKIRYSDNLFGIIPVGKWVDIKPDMSLGLKKFHRGFVGYIRGTQPAEIHENDIRIVIYDAGHRQIMQVKKVDSVEKSGNDLLELTNLLGLSRT